MVDPLTGVYAAVANNEVIGARFAVEQINAKGGVLGRPLELLVEDSANDVGTGVQKTRKLIERDQVSFIIGDVNSGIAQAMAQVTRRKEGAARRLRRPHRRHYRQGLQVERLSRLQYDARRSQLRFRASVHQVRQEMAFHHSGLCLRSYLAAGGRSQSEKARRHNDRQRAHPARHHRFLRVSHQGACRQSGRAAGVAAGLRHGELPEADRPVRHRQANPCRRIAAGARSRSKRCRRKRASASGCSSGTGSSRASRMSNNSSPTSANAATARCRRRAPGSAITSVQTYALAANHEKTLDAVKLAKALGNFELPPDVKLQPNKVLLPRRAIIS